MAHASSLNVPGRLAQKDPHSADYHSITESAMLKVLQILTLVVVVVALAAALAHVLELPGKMRLTKEAYFTVQPIYYPGFTIAGASEPLGIVLTLILVIATASEGAGFWLMLAALGGLIGMQLVYWLVTHRVNKVWLRGEKLGAIGSGFFSFASATRKSDSVGPVDWTLLRDRWEYSHVLRAGFAGLSFMALVIAAHAA
jgi:hypothetical protein